MANYIDEMKGFLDVFSSEPKKFEMKGPGVDFSAKGGNCVVSEEMKKENAGKKGYEDFNATCAQGIVVKEYNMNTANVSHVVDNIVSEVEVKAIAPHLRPAKILKQKPMRMGPRREVPMPSWTKTNIKTNSPIDEPLTSGKTKAALALGAAGLGAASLGA